MDRLTLSDQGMSFLVGWETCILKPYRDQAKKLTIGIGHLLTQDELKHGILYIEGDKVSWRNGITESQAYRLKRQDLRSFIEAVNDRMRAIPLRQHQFDALVIYAFNIGVHAFCNVSSVPSNLLRGRVESAIESWRRWNKITVNGIRQVSRGLTKRREAEIALFISADYSGRP